MESTKRQRSVDVTTKVWQARQVLIFDDAQIRNAIERPVPEPGSVPGRSGLIRRSNDDLVNRHPPRIGHDEGHRFGDVLGMQALDFAKH